MGKKTTHVTLDLTQLRHPSEANALIDLVEHADLDSGTLRQIRDAAAARLMPNNAPDFAALHAQYEATLHVAMRERIGADADPSIQSFREFLNSLPKRVDTTYEEKKEIVKTVNYWKSVLNVEFFYGGVPCTLKASGSNNGRHGQGAYGLRATGTAQTAMYGKAEFPAIQIRSAKRKP